MQSLQLKKLCGKEVAAIGCGTQKPDSSHSPLPRSVTALTPVGYAQQPLGQRRQTCANSTSQQPSRRLTSATARSTERPSDVCASKASAHGADAPRMGAEVWSGMCDACTCAQAPSSLGQRAKGLPFPSLLRSAYQSSECTAGLLLLSCKCPCGWPRFKGPVAQLSSQIPNCSHSNRFEHGI
jgi:hypothetical protein